MTFDEAVAILTRQGAPGARARRERGEALYTLEDPTQPLSYLVGREMILELRRRYKEREGQRYTLKALPHRAALARRDRARAARGGDVRGVGLLCPTSAATMRFSSALIPTVREAPADAGNVSHALLTRGGFIRKIGAGSYDFLPLGLRVLRKVEAIIRREA